MDDIYNKAAVAEYHKAFSELGIKKTASTALQKSFLRYENLIASAVDDSTIKPACKAGFSFCCHYKVEVKAHEVFAIKTYMDKNFTQNQVSSVLHAAKENANLIRTITQAEHLTTNIKCPFLMDNNCSIYPARPYKCRNFHSTEYDACEKSYLNPADLTIENSFIESVAMFGNAHSQGFEGAIKNIGLDTRTYDFNTALLEVFTEPKAEKRYQRGKKTFVTAIEINETLD